MFVFFNFVAPQSCDIPLDVVFLVESSENVSPNAFLKVKDFIKDAIKCLLTSGGEQQVGVILYSGEATKEITFGQYSSEFDFNEAIDKLPLEKGEARLDKALQLASSEMFADDGGT